MMRTHQPPSPHQPELRLPSVTAAMSATLGAELLNILFLPFYEMYMPDAET